MPSRYCPGTVQGNYCQKSSHMQTQLRHSLRRLSLWATGCLLLSGQWVFAQQSSRIKGMVLDDKGTSLPGVTIQLNEAGAKTIRGAVTNEKGIFQFDNLKAGSRYDFLFSAVGYEKQMISDYLINAADNNSLLIRMKPSSKALNDVVVIGYGQQSKSRVTGAISQVRSKELSRYNGASFAQQLAGRAAGVVINDASAQPGTDPQIVIRGIGTLTAGRNPLIVVDGFPLSEGTSFNSINPQDIETLNILKDPASAAIYGSRAANGVILITTKKGKQDQFHVSLDVYSGVQERADQVKYVNAYDAATYFTEARDWGYVSKNPAGRSISDDRATRLSKGASLRELRLNYLQPYLDKTPGLTNTNWLDEVFRKGKLNSYNLSISGGSAKTNYYISGNYFNQEGIVLNNGLKRYSGTIKIDSRPSDKLEIGVSLNPSYNTQDYFDNNANSSNDPISGIYIMYPFFSPYNPDGSLAISNQIKANTPEDGALGENAVALAQKIKNKRNTFRTFGNGYLSLELLKGLKFKTLAGGDVISTYFDFYNPSDVGQYRGAAPKPAIAIETKGLVVNYLWENTLTYNRSFGHHNLDLLGGYTFQKEMGNSTAVTAGNIPDDNLPNTSGGSAFSVETKRYTWVQISYLARAQYSYRDKYLFSATVRRDGSSRFGDNRKWGNFPSFTAGWVLSKESFFPTSDLLSFAKVRATWGQSGNNQIGNYSAAALVKPDNYVFGNTLAPGFAANTTANGHLSWETKTSTNIGLDVTFLKHFNLTADYYSSITRDLLLNVPVPDQSGYSTSIQNIGKVKNSGLEVELSGNNIPLGAVTWSWSANIATNRNTVLALTPGQQQIITGPASNFRTRVGGPVAELIGYNVTGVYKTQEDIDKTPHLQGTVPGDYIVEDVNKDGKINEDDRIGFGTYNPKFTYGFSTSFAYRGFELSVALNGVQGRTIFDQQIANSDESGEGFSVPSQYYFDHRYHPIDNPNGFLAQPNMGNFSSARKTIRASNMFYKDGSYLRIRNVQLSYTLPNSWINRLRMSGVNIYVSANNLFTFTSFRGFNPDATSVDNVLTNGLSIANYPVARSFVAGIHANF